MFLCVGKSKVETIGSYNGQKIDSCDLNEDDQGYQELSLQWGRLYQCLKKMRPEILASICDLSSRGGESLGAWAKRTNSRECEEGGDRTSE